jgi:hypothetical protein
MRYFCIALVLLGLCFGGESREFPVKYELGLYCVQCNKSK